MDPLQMDSIWVEEDTRGKLYNVSHPNMEVLNSSTPHLGSRNTVDLPPLPPTSYFTTWLAQREDEKQKLKNKKSGGKLLSAFKKSFMSGTEKEIEREKQKLRTKISTPFDFSHISHVNKDSTITNRTFEIPVPRDAVVDDAYQLSPSTRAERKDSTRGVAFNRTEPATPQSRNMSASSRSSTIPRSASLATSLASNTFSATRHASISTNATSTKTISRKNTTCHAHTASSSSIEQLTKLEKYQISKQCNPDYSSASDPSSRTNSLDATPSLTKDSLEWDTPSPDNLVRQSWIYTIPDSPQPMYKTGSNAMLRSSLLLMQTPMREQIDKFTTTLDTSFDEGPEFAQIQKGMAELSVLFGVTGDEQTEDEVQEAMASMRAARVSRASRDVVGEIGEIGLAVFKEKLRLCTDEVEEEDFDEAGEDIDVVEVDDVDSINTVATEDEIDTPI